VKIYPCRWVRFVARGQLGQLGEDSGEERG
jgi:hypothetical protein